MLMIVAALAGVVLGWAVGRPVDNWLDANLESYPKKTVITACAVAIFGLALLS